MWYWVGNVPENVTLTGWVDDIHGAFGAGNVYLFVMRNENQGIVALEAMTCGKAVVVRDIPVSEEFYARGHDCLKCSTDAEFRRTLDLLVHDPDLRQQFGENAREAAAKHSSDRIGNRLVEAYKDMPVGRFEDWPVRYSTIWKLAR